MANKKKMKAQTVARPISPKELKFWLEGILEFQDSDWLPNAEQWKNIQEKIFNLEETVTPVMVQQLQPNRPSPNAFAPPEGGVPGLSPSPFPVIGTAGSGLTEAPITLPVRDEKGYLKMPEDFGVSDSPVPPSNGPRHKFNPNGFE